MGVFALACITLTLSVTAIFGHLRMRKICEAGDPTGTGTLHTLLHANNYMECARACDVNPNCSYVSFHGNECVMYKDESACGINGGVTRDVYKVDPQCDTGWHRYSGSCYSVLQEPYNAGDLHWLECPRLGTSVVAISTPDEGLFLSQLLQFQNVSDPTVWTAGGIGSGEWTWFASPEAWGYYQNWADGEPNNPESERCLALNIADAEWHSENCTVPRIGVCEKEL